MIIKDLSIIDYFSYVETSTERNATGQALLTSTLLPIYKGSYETDIEQAPDILIIGADLQGLVQEQGQYRLMGVVLPVYLQLLIEATFIEKAISRIGCLLCGDLYASPEKRGQSGDVREVWEAFQEVFDWVVGVAGNHDRFGEEEEGEFLTAPSKLLHQDTHKVDGLNLGGISGIIGKPTKAQRVAKDVFLKKLEHLLTLPLDAILLHETPNFPALQLMGNPAIRQILQAAQQPTTIFCGHCHWEVPLVQYENGIQVLNVDKRVVLLEKNIN